MHLIYLRGDQLVAVCRPRRLEECIALTATYIRLHGGWGHKSRRDISSASGFTDVIL